MVERISSAHLSLFVQKGLPNWRLDVFPVVLRISFLSDSCPFLVEKRNINWMDG